MTRYLSDFKEFFGNIRTLHKIVIGLLFLSLIFSIQKDVQSSRKTMDETFELSKTVCLYDKNSNKEQIDKCIFEERQRYDEYTNSSIQTDIISNIVIHIVYFTLYMIIYLILSTLFYGYRKKYDWSILSKKNKFLHIVTITYTILVLFLVFLGLRTTKVELMFPVTGERKSYYQSTDDLFATGVWVRDTGRSEISVEDIGTMKSSKEGNYLLPNVSIYCDKIEMVCEHKTVSLSSYSSLRTVELEDTISSKIEYWGKDSLKSTFQKGCLIHNYYFDNSNKNVFLLIKYSDEPKCISVYHRPNSYKLYDGIDLNMKLKKKYFWDFI